MGNRRLSIYTAESDSLFFSISELWRFKSLIWVFAKRDIQVKYAQTFLGLGWSLFKPLLGLVIYVFFFGTLLNWTSKDIPYPVYVLTGLIGWNLFTFIVSSGISSIQESTDLIKKIYFPKSVLPLSKALVGIIEAGISFLLLIPLLLYYNVQFNWHLLLLPIVLLYNIFCGLFIAFTISSLAIVKRDLLQVVPFLLNMAIWFTPVFFTPDILPNGFEFLMNYNPFANMVDLWRWLFLKGMSFSYVWVINFFLIQLLTVLSFWFYTKQENKFSDF